MMGKLIIIEGTDGSGKQTQTSLLLENLLKMGISSKKISFPDYDNEGSAGVKMFLRGDLGDLNDISPYASSALYAVDRYTSYKQTWEKFIDNGDIVIADRYTISNLIHQGNRIKDEKEFYDFSNFILDLEWNKFGLPKPDLIILLDMPYDFSNSLIKDRPNKLKELTKKDILESNETQKKNAYDTAIKLANRYGYHIISCVKNNELRSIDDIQQEIFNLVKEVLS